MLALWSSDLVQDLDPSQISITDFNVLTAKDILEVKTIACTLSEFDFRIAAVS